jgi:hypothetical protein
LQFFLQSYEEWHNYATPMAHIINLQMQMAHIWHRNGMEKAHLHTLKTDKFAGE